MKLVTKQITNDLSSDNKNVFELSLDLCFWWKDIYGESHWDGNINGREAQLKRLTRMSQALEDSTITRRAHSGSLY